MIKMRETANSFLPMIKYTFEHLKSKHDPHNVLMLLDDDELVARVNTIMPYYVEEMRDSSYYSLHEERRKDVSVKGQCTEVFPIIKSIMHLRPFYTDEEKCSEVFRQKGEINEILRFANEQACFSIVYMTYLARVKDKVNASILRTEHLFFISDLFCSTLERLRKNISSIAIEYIDALFGQIALVHDNITAQGTGMLLNKNGFTVSLTALSDDYDKIGLLMFDIDNFKQVNDDCGHDAGDECLEKIGKRTALIVEKHKGIAARVGGEEFYMAFPGVNKETLTAIASELNEEFNEIPRENPKNRNEFEKGGSFVNYMSSSIGIGIWDTLKYQCDRDLAFDRLFRELDNAMYQSKNRGRNRSTFTCLDLE